MTEHAIYVSHRVKYYNNSQLDFYASVKLYTYRRKEDKIPTCEVQMYAEICAFTGQDIIMIKEDRPCRHTNTGGI